MRWISDNDILIVGLGLMGGSYAKRLRSLGYHVEAIDTRPEAITYAVEHGIIDCGYTEPTEDAIRRAGVLIFAVYPHVFVDWIRKWGHLIRWGAMVTDVTGVKSGIVEEVQQLLPAGVEFIASHPMAGREVYGVENADDRIFRDANYIVVPTEKNTAEGIEWSKELGRLLGFARISVLSPEEHDRMIGFVSQLTHVIAVALMTCSDSTHLVDYTGDSFRDLTRIARINDAMWSELFLMNKAPLLEQMDTFIDEMHTLRGMLEAEDKEGLREKMRLSTARRALFNK